MKHDAPEIGSLLLTHAHYHLVSRFVAPRVLHHALPVIYWRRGGPQPQAGAEAERRGDLGGWSVGAGRYRFSQAGQDVGRSRPAVLGDPGESRQLPDRGHLLLH